MIDDPEIDAGDLSPLERALRGLIVSARRPDLSAAPGADVQYAVEDVEIGRLLIATRADGTLLASSFTPDGEHEEVVLARLAHVVSPRVLRGGSGPSAVLRQLEQYLAGTRRRFDLPIDLSLATPFQQAVLGGLSDRVAYGRTASYREVAVAMQRPTAARAIGAALASNPLCIVLPCHRVIASSGRLNGYAGGVEAKKALLTLERTVSGE
jgi:methylated-DNA-[protein]-cysteine S-methyltransferase